MILFSLATTSSSFYRKRAIGDTVNLVPMLVIVVVLYNLFAVTAILSLAKPVFTFVLLSSATWQVTGNDLLLILGLILLYIELFKATYTTRASILDHLFSMLLFIVCLVEFLVWPQAGNSTFFLILLMTLIDVVAGFTVSIAASRRDFGIDR